MIRLDTASFVPIYEQIKAGIRGRIALAALKPGDALPSIRDLAAELIVNPNTVARAYRELEQEGVITTRQGKGCFVSDRSESVVREEKRAALDRILDRAVDEAGRFGFSAAEIRGALEKSLNDRGSRSRGGKT
ncbi:MAG: GntR family transcriptional regulator [Candidatus Aminicenantes bacterium]|nr:GntR family transcriptional regulator [Candidatus Aminicenantes bacterium]